MSESFSGHDIETGLLQRVRSWRELLPPLGLLPALRVAGSPLHVAMWCGWLIAVQACLVATGVIPQATWNMSDSIWAADGMAWSDIASRLSDFTAGQWAMLTVIELLSIFPAAVTMRAGALYAAGREGEGFTDTVRLTLARWKTLLQVTLLPWVCILGLSLPLFLPAVATRVPTVGRGIAELLGLLTSPLLILIGLLGTGALVAIPLALASVAVEKRDDGFDALSRGYEYFFRRPVQTVVYGFCSGLLMVLVGAIAILVSLAALGTARAVMSVASEPAEMLVIWEGLFTTLPLAALVTTKTALCGAMYLLLRYDANAQDIEQLAVSQVDRQKPAYPSL